MHTTPSYDYELARHLPELQLTRLGDDSEAGLWITSLPCPRSLPSNMALDAQPTYVKALGQWPDEPAPAPRRLLMIADGQNHAPRNISPSLDAQEHSAEYSPPSASMELFARSPVAAFVWEQHLLRVSWKDKSIGLAMGLRRGEDVHWWEACRMLVLEETPQCLTVEMGGAIPLELISLETLQNNPAFKNPFLHKHNWLNGHLYLRLHANGVCEVFAHHINSKFYDDGLPLEDAVPVIGIHGASREELEAQCGSWTGEREILTIGGARFDVSEAARLATPEQPGNLSESDGLLVWQPYQGMELFGGGATHEITGNEYICRAEDHVIPRGMARTVRFSFSLSDRSPRVARYVAPAWWHGACEDFLPEPLLPISNEYDQKYDEAREWVRENMRQRGFEDGAIPIAAPKTFAETGLGSRRDSAPRRPDSGWKGDLPYGQFLGAWRSSDEDDYNCALRSAYYFTDVVVDHTVKSARMQGFPPHAVSVTLNRTQGSIAAYLEIGDPYLLETAKAVAEASFRLHKNSWPRMAVGRDACFASGAALLYRYFADEHFRHIAHEIALDVAHSQKPDGSFGDQGGGAGVHGFAAYITKPWMGLLAQGAVLDYLELFPDEPVLLECAKKFADWLMTVRFDHEGVMGWSYQHDYDGKSDYYCWYSAQWHQLPGTDLWHQETLARLLGFCALRFDEPGYLDAWAESHNAHDSGFFDYPITATLQYLTWLQAKLWNARLTQDGIQIQPYHFGPRTPREGHVMTPNGVLTLEWSDSGEVIAPPEVEVAMDSPVRVLQMA